MGIPNRKQAMSCDKSVYACTLQSPSSTLKQIVLLKYIEVVLHVLHVVQPYSLKPLQLEQSRENILKMVACQPTQNLYIFNQYKIRK